MSERPPNKEDLDLRPLTVEHGRKLLAKSVEISEQLKRLMPLLVLLESQPAEEAADPIQTIVRLLETLVEAMQDVEDKLDRLLTNYSRAP